MLNILWFMAQTALLLWAIVWVANNPGTVRLEWLDYTVELHVGLFIAVLLVAVLVLFYAYRALFFLLDLPAMWGKFRRRRHEARGRRALILGFSALAVGDTKIASYQAWRARQLIPEDRGFVSLLEGQSATLAGDAGKARQAFTTLLGHKDTAALGLRGLLHEAVVSGNTAEALRLTHQARALYPRQGWVARIEYHLAIRAHDWNDALNALLRAEKAGAFDPLYARSARIALLLQQGLDREGNGQTAAAFGLYKKAWALDHAHIAAAQYAARAAIALGRRGEAEKIIAATWKHSPHPDLAAQWDVLAPEKTARHPLRRLRWAERLLDIKPDHVESYLAIAAAALEDSLWGEARHYLSLAEESEAGARVYALRAEVEKRASRPSEAGQWLARAAEAPAGKIWFCTQTGRTYDHWTPLAPPHDSFNTIIWDYPGRAGLAHASADSANLLPATLFS